jgi:hypothetical protein
MNESRDMNEMNESREMKGFTHSRPCTDNDDYDDVSQSVKGCLGELHKVPQTNRKSHGLCIVDFVGEVVR